MLALRIFKREWYTLAQYELRLYLQDEELCSMTGQKPSRPPDSVLFVTNQILTIHFKMDDSPDLW